MARGEGFKVTEEELEKFHNAIKKQEFRDLLTDYVREIQDPVNKKRYEEEIVELERKRGQNVRFINPKPGFVIRIYLEPGRRKLFINVCTSEVIAEATSIPIEAVGSNKKSGSDWHIPYSLIQPRDDLDKTGKTCFVYDCVYHPKAYQKGQKYPRFKQLLVDTAVEAVEMREGAKNASGKVKFLSMPYKGMIQSAMIRQAHFDVKETKRNRVGEGEKKEKKEEEKGKEKEVASDDDSLPFVYPPLKTESAKKKKLKATRPPVPNEPKYSVKYRGEVAMGDYTNDRVSRVIKRPKEIVVTVELPGVLSAATVELDVLEKQLLLDNKAPPYHLDLALSYPVDTGGGKAEFNKSARRLTITLPILPPSHPPSLPTPPPSPPATKPTNQVSESELRDLAVEESTNQIAPSVDDDNLTNHDTGTEELTNHDPAPGHVTWVSKGEWSPPLFTYHQDTERVVFVLHSRGVKASTVVHHSDQHQVQVLYSRVSEDKQTTNHSFLVRFHDDDLVDSTSVDVSVENMVVVVTKTEESRKMWAWFEAGANPQSTERKLFLTEANVTSGIEDMKTHHDPWVMTSSAAASNENCAEQNVDTTAWNGDSVEQSQDTTVRNEDIVERNGDKAVSNLEQNEDSGVWNEDVTEETTRGVQVCDVTCEDRSGETIEQSDQRERDEDDRAPSQTSNGCGHKIQLNNELLFDLD